MNRIILIGNGFDLAHGLKTSYADFINWYWEEWGKRLMVGKKYKEEDEFCSFELQDNFGIGNWYLVRDWHYQNINMSAMEFIQRVKEDTNLCFYKYKSPFFEQINKSIETKGWVDIENEYYSMLVQKKTFGNRYYTLNKQLDFLREKLMEYLNVEELRNCIMYDEVKDKIYRPIKEREIAISYGTPHENLSPINVLILNFNYTNTPKMYSEDNSSINYIHGMLKEPKSVIFGYGG